MAFRLVTSPSDEKLRLCSKRSLTSSEVKVFNDHSSAFEQYLKRVNEAKPAKDMTELKIKRRETNQIVPPASLNFYVDWNFTPNLIIASQYLCGISKYNESRPSE